MRNAGVREVLTRPGDFESVQAGIPRRRLQPAAAADIGELPAADERDGGFLGNAIEQHLPLARKLDPLRVGIELAQRPVEVEEEEQMAGAPPRLDSFRREPDVSLGHSTRCSRGA